MDDSFKISIVKAIIKGDVEEALIKLSERFNVKPPRIKVGTVKGHRKACAVYRQYDKTIYVSNREFLYNPAVILHEYYHYIQKERYGKNGNEKYADKFAKDFFRTHST